MNKEYTVLIVDDDKMVLELGKRILSKEGYRVTTISDSEEAINILKTTKFDLLITDYNMPKFNGFEVIDKLKEYSPDTACILWSGTVDKDMLGSMQCEFLEKPFSVDKLISMVKKVLVETTE